MEQLEIKYPLKKLTFFALGVLLTLVFSFYDIQTDDKKINVHFIITLLLAVVNLIMAILEIRKYRRPILLDKEGILYGKERYFWSSLASCSLDNVEENKLHLSFKETYAKPVTIDLNNYQYNKRELERALQHFPPSPIFQEE